MPGPQHVVVQISEAKDDVAIAEAAELLRAAGFGSAADELIRDGTRPPEYVLLARDAAGAPLGVLQGRQPSEVVDDDGSERTSALLTHLAVDPAHRRTGVGSSLISEFCVRSFAAGAELVVLQIGPATGERADSLTAFYEANRFVVHGPGFRRELKGGT